MFTQTHSTKNYLNQKNNKRKLKIKWYLFLLTAQKNMLSLQPIAFLTEFFQKIMKKSLTGVQKIILPILEFVNRGEVEASRMSKT